MSLLVKNGKYCTEIGSRRSLFIGLGPNELHSRLTAGVEYGPGTERVGNGTFFAPQGLKTGTVPQVSPGIFEKGELFEHLLVSQKSSTLPFDIILFFKMHTRTPCFPDTGRGLFLKKFELFTEIGLFHGLLLDPPGGDGGRRPRGIPAPSSGAVG